MLPETQKLWLIITQTTESSPNDILLCLKTESLYRQLLISPTPNFTVIEIFVFLQAIMDRFYDPKTCRDQCGLAALRVILKCDQVNADTSKNYHAISLFLDKVLDAHLHCFALQKLPEDQDVNCSQGKIRHCNVEGINSTDSANAIKYYSAWSCSNCGSSINHSTVGWLILERHSLST